MAREVFQIQAKDAVLKIGNYAAINAVQSFDWDPTFNEEYFEQLGDDTYMGYAIAPEVSGSFEMGATGSTVAFLKRMINRFDNDEYNGYMAGTVADNAGTIRGRDLEYTVFDLIEAKKANEQFTRSLLLPRAHLSTLSFSMDTTGRATETYSFEGDLAEVYRNATRDISTIPVTRTVGSLESSVTVADPVTYALDVPGGANESDATHLIHCLYIDDVRVEAEDLNPVWAADSFTGDIDVDGVEVKQGARLSLVIYAKNPGDFPTIPHPTSARFVRADDIDIWLISRQTLDLSNLADGALNSTVFPDNDLFLRVQSASLNIDLRREALRQIRKNNRNTSVFYRAATYPLQITADATTMETTLLDWQKLAGLTSGDVLDLGSFENQEWQIVIRYYHGDDVLQTMALLDARVNGRGTSLSVGGRSEITWSFTGSDVVIEGSNV